MQLITKTIEKQLLENAKKQAEASKKGKTIDFKPVVKFFSPVGAATWLITEMTVDGDDKIGFGLCDMGFGLPELGYVDMNELMAYTDKYGVGIERDMWFIADKTLSEYARIARDKGHIDA